MTNITLPRAVVEQALEALEMCRLNGSQYLYGNERDLVCSAIKALRAALAQQAKPVEPYTDDVTRIMREAGMTFHLGLPHKAVVEQMTRVVDLVYAEASIKAAQQFAAALAQHPDTDCHTQGICQRSGYGIGKQADPQIEDRLARHGINPCPDCRGIGYDASGQLCWCQQNPSF